MTTSDKIAGKIMGRPKQRPTSYLIASRYKNHPVDYRASSLLRGLAADRRPGSFSY
jgi:hypothetical protein